MRALELGDALSLLRREHSWRCGRLQEVRVLVDVADDFDARFHGQIIR